MDHIQLEKLIVAQIVEVSFAFRYLIRPSSFCFYRPHKARLVLLLETSQSQVRFAFRDLIRPGLFYFYRPYKAKFVLLLETS